MENLDKQASAKEISDEELLLNEVIRGEADLLYLDSFLSELLRRR